MENKNNENSVKTFKDYKGIFKLIVACILLAAVLFYFPYILKTVNHYLNYLSSILYGIFIAFLLNPITNYFYNIFFRHYSNSRKEKLRNKAAAKAKRLSIFVSVTIGILIVFALAMLIIPEVLNSIIKLGGETPALIDALTDKISEWNNDRSWAGAFEKYIDQVLAMLQNWVTTSLVPSASFAFQSLTSAAIEVVKFVFNFAVGFVIAVYVLKDKKMFLSWGKKFTFAFAKPETANLIIDTCRHGNKIFGRYLIGSLIDSTVVGIITFIFNIIVGIPYPLLIAALIGLTNMIPFFGPFLGAVPSAFLVLIIDPIKALIFVVFILILQQIEGNIIAPKVLGNTTGISEFGVTFALLFFGAMFGIAGMLLGVPLLAVLVYLIKDLTNKHMAKKGLNCDAEFYSQVDSYDPVQLTFNMIDPKKAEEEQNERVKPKNEKFGKAIERFERKIMKKNNNTSDSDESKK